MYYLTMIIDRILPKQCIKCGGFGEYVCQACARKFLDVRRAQQCHVCKKLISTNSAEVGLIKSFTHEECKPVTSLDGVLVCLNYTKLAERIIAEIKYGHYTDIANYVVPYYFDKLKLLEGLNKQILLVPVPLFKKKKRARGFNQAELFAEKLLKLNLKSNSDLGTELMYANLLRRVKNTKTQVGLTREERLINLNEAFEIEPKLVEKKNYFQEKIVVLIDDVMTTGTTLEECSAVLKANGAGSVYAIVFTRG